MLNSSPVCIIFMQNTKTDIVQTKNICRFRQLYEVMCLFCRS